MSDVPMEERFFVYNKKKWCRGTKIYIGWPHLRRHQLRVCLGLFKSKRTWIGYFARVEDDTDEEEQEEFFALPLSDKPLVTIVLSSTFFAFFFQIFA